MERDAEIAQIKRDLEILRARHALYERWGRILKVFFVVWAPVLIIISIVALALRLAAFGAVYSGLFLGLFAVVAAILWLFHYAPSADLFQLRWIDLASAPLFGSSFSFRRNDVQMIEEQIAERERRLAELGVSS